jgi:hypothetical protein
VGVTLDDYRQDARLRVRLAGFRHHYGQPPEIRRAFEEAMGIAD